MDKNSAIGLTLIAALLFAYFYWFAPTPQPVQKTSPTVQNIQSDTVRSSSPVVSDSALAATYGDLSTVAQGREEETTIETQDVRVTFSNRGGIIKSLELIKYTSYQDYKKARKGNQKETPF
jgi:YidC/Oxa1 family membrane protein insertase